MEIEPDSGKAASDLTRTSLYRLSARDRYRWSRGSLSAALRALDKKVENADDPRRLLARRGILRRRAGCSDGALRDLREEGVPPWQLGAALVETGRYQEAVTSLSRALNDDGTLWWARLWRAEALLRLGQRLRAGGDLDEARRRRPRSPVPDLLFGRHGSAGALDKAVRLAPRDLWPRLLRAASAVSAGRMNQARRDLDRALIADPQNKWARLIRARVRDSLKDRKGAFKDFEQALSADPDVNGSAFSWQQGDPAPEDLTYLDRFLSRSPNVFWALAWRGQLYYDMLRPREAMRDLSAAVRSRPRCGWARALWARALVRWEGDQSNGIEELTRAADDSPGCAWIKGWRGILRAKTGDLEGALEDYDASIAGSPHYALSYSWRADLRIRTGDMTGALQDLDLAVELDPSYGSNYEKRRKIRWLQGERAGAFEDLVNAVAREPRFSWTPFEGGPRHQVALDELSAELRERPRSFWALAWRGETRMKGGDLSRGLTDLEAALRIDPSRGWVWAWKGESLRRLGRDEEAAASLDRAIALEPSYGRAYGWRALLRAAAGDDDRALKDLEQTLRFDFGCAWAYRLRAQLRAKAGKWRAALEDLDRALVLDPNYRQAYTLRVKVLKKLGRTVLAARDMKKIAALV